MERRLALWLVPIFTTIHNVEEALVMPIMLERRNSSVPGFLEKLLPQINYKQFLIALVITTAIPYAIAACGDFRMKDGRSVYLLLIFQSMTLINVFAHGMMAVMLGGYAPGLATSIFINLPFSIYFFKRAYREQWANKKSLQWAFVFGGILHFPGLTIVLLIAGSIANKI